MTTSVRTSLILRKTGRSKAPSGAHRGQRSSYAWPAVEPSDGAAPVWHRAARDDGDCSAGSARSRLKARSPSRRRRVDTRLVAPRPCRTAGSGDPAPPPADRTPGVPTTLPTSVWWPSERAAASQSSLQRKSPRCSRPPECAGVYQNDGEEGSGTGEETAGSIGDPGEETAGFARLTQAPAFRLSEAADVLEWHLGRRLAGFVLRSARRLAPRLAERCLREFRSGGAGSCPQIQPKDPERSFLRPRSLAGQRFSPASSSPPQGPRRRPASATCAHGWTRNVLPSCVCPTEHEPVP